MMLTKKTLSDCMTEAGEIYAKEVSPVQMRGFYRLLANYTDDDVRAAFDDHYRDSIRGKWFPMPACIIAQLEGTIDQAQDEAEATCLTSWDKANWTPVQQATAIKKARTTARVEWERGKRASRGRAPTPAQQIGKDTTDQARIAPTRQPAAAPERSEPSAAEIEGRAALKSLIGGM